MKLDKEKISNKFDNMSKEIQKVSEQVFEKAKSFTSAAADKTKEITTKSKDTVVTAIDANGDGKIDIEDIIILGLKTPGVGIDRNSFLKKELMKNYSPEVIDNAIAATPAKAGIPLAEVDLLADNVIQFERTCVTGISTALGVPGGAAMVATIPTDIIQYYGYMLRTAQKLMYLYGFPEISIDEKAQVFDSETLNMLTVCLGVMYGVAGANNAIKAMAKALASGVEKKLVNKALTKGTIYPIVKNIAKWFGKKMTKEVFAGFFKKAIPVVGGVIGGGITYLTFKPCCENLKATLRDTKLSNPEYEDDKEENIIIDIECTEE